VQDLVNGVMRWKLSPRVMRGQKRVVKGVYARLRRAMDARERAYDPRIDRLRKNFLRNAMDCTATRACPSCAVLCAASRVNPTCGVKPGNDGVDGRAHNLTQCGFSSARFARVRPSGAECNRQVCEISAIVSALLFTMIFATPTCQSPSECSNCLHGDVVEGACGSLRRGLGWLLDRRLPCRLAAHS
jgi:hypothetical protein